MSSNTAVYGLYKDRPAVEEAAEILKRGGFRNADISVLFSENQGSKDFALEKNTKAPEGALAGAVVGALVGAFLGWLIGAGMLAIPGAGPLIAAGPVMAMLAGIGAGGALGAVVGALVGMSMPEYEARRYEGRIRNGGVLMSVHCDSPFWVTRAETLLKQTGGEGIASAAEGKADFMIADKPIPRVTTNGA